jgi:hypothetical protein
MLPGTMAGSRRVRNAAARASGGVAASTGAFYARPAGVRQSPGRVRGPGLPTAHRRLAEPSRDAIFGPVRAAIVMAEVMADQPEATAIVQRLDAAGVRSVILAGAGEPPAAVPTAGHLRFDAPVPAPACWSEGVGLLAAAARRIGVTPHEAFLVCADGAAVSHGVAAGCRPVVVLGPRSLTDVFGAAEPAVKHVPVAPDLATAVGYCLDEAAQEAELGPFPFDAGPSLDGRIAPVGPSGRDLALIFGVVTVAGVAAALGIAYLLQEVYQTVRFPAVVYYLTLQPIPQTWRGLLFLAFGVALGYVAALILSRVSRRLRERR